MDRVAPTLLLVYNRPVEAERVARSILAARPSALFLSADGPVKGNPVDGALCRAARDAVLDLDWDCPVHLNLQEENSGLQRAVESGITWFFNNVDSGIILEDDVLPSDNFFSFATEALETYYHDNRIMKISGFNPLAQQSYSELETHFFSNLSFSWGWATWARAWRKYSSQPELWHLAKERRLARFPLVDWYSRRAFKSAYKDDSTWDYQWDFSIASQNGLHLISSENLITNIGFGPRATNTTFNPLTRRELSLASGKYEPLRPTALVMPDLVYHRKLRRLQVWGKVMRFLSAGKS